MDRKIVEYLLQQKSQRWIVKQLKVSDRRVRRVTRAAKEFGYLDSVALPLFPATLFPEPVSRPLTPSENDELLLPKRDWIKERLSVGWRPITVSRNLA